MAKTLEELIEMAESEDLYYLLDETVHDCKSEEASNINNNGPIEQIAYLVESGISLIEIEKLLNETEE